MPTHIQQQEDGRPLNLHRSCTSTKLVCQPCCKADHRKQDGLLFAWSKVALRLLLTCCRVVLLGSLNWSNLSLWASLTQCIWNMEHWLGLATWSSSLHRKSHHHFDQNLCAYSRQSSTHTWIDDTSPTLLFDRFIFLGTCQVRAPPYNIKINPNYTSISPYNIQTFRAKDSITHKRGTRTTQYRGWNEVLPSEHTVWSSGGIC